MTADGARLVTLRVNGKARQVHVEPRRLLVDALRHDLKLTGTHVGCEHGVCGACTVFATTYDYPRDSAAGVFEGHRDSMRKGGVRHVADTIRLVDYFYIELSDRPGEGARALSVLREAGVHLIALHAFPAGRRAQMDFAPSDPGAFRAAAKMAKWKITGPKKAFVIEGEDRTGALVNYFAKLGEAKINVTAASAIAAGAGRFGAILWVKARDVKRAANALGAG